MEFEFTQVRQQLVAEQFRPLLELVSNNGGYIMGGLARYLASRRTAPLVYGDVDVFVPDEERFLGMLSAFSGLDCIYETEMSRTYASAGLLIPEVEIQLIKPRCEADRVTCGTPLEILSKFDFTVAAAWWVSPHLVMVHPQLLEHDEIGSLRLIMPVQRPVSTTVRAMKYARRGFYLPFGETVRLLDAWERAPRTYRDRARDFVRRWETGELTTEELIRLEFEL